MSKIVLKIYKKIWSKIDLYRYINILYCKMNINQMESDIDILRIHEDINNNIKIQLDNRVYIERRLNHINSILENDDLKDTILRKCEKIKKELIQTLDNITNNYYSI